MLALLLQKLIFFFFLKIPVLINLSQDADVDLPIKPLIFALAIGACFGGKKYVLPFIIHTASEF